MVKKQGHDQKSTVWKEDEGWIHKIREREEDKLNDKYRMSYGKRN